MIKEYNLVLVLERGDDAHREPACQHLDRQILDLCSILMRFLDARTPRLHAISRVASSTGASFAGPMERPPSIKAVSSSRVRSEAGSLVALEMG